MGTNLPSKIRRRHACGLTGDSSSIVRDVRKSADRTLTWEEAEEWQRDNPYIRHGYRPGTASFPELLSSRMILHNETRNVYTHLVGAASLPFFALPYIQLLSDTRFAAVTKADYFMFGLFFGTAECCLIISTLYHLYMSHSRRAEQFWLRMDLLGIITVTEGTHISGINYIFPCEPYWQRVYWASVSGLNRPIVLATEWSSAYVDPRS